MKCACGQESKVTDSRVSPDGSVMRRRRCPSCGLRWTTREVMVRAASVRIVDADAVLALRDAVATVSDRLTDVLALSERPSDSWPRRRPDLSPIGLTSLPGCQSSNRPAPAPTTQETIP